MAVEHGLHVLLETPIAHDLAEADAIIAAAAQRGLKVEVAEQFHRRPLEQIKLELIASGLFGRSTRRSTTSPATATMASASCAPTSALTRGPCR